MVERTQAEAQAAKAAEAEAVRVAKEAERVQRDVARTRDAAVSRAEGAAKEGLTPEKVARAAETRVGEADKRLKGQAIEAGRKAKTTQGEIDRMAKAAVREKDIEKHWDSVQTIMKSERPEDVARESKTFLKDMLKKDYVSNDDYTRMIEQVQALEDVYKDKEAAARQMRNLRNMISASFIGDMAARFGFAHLRRPIGF